MKLEGEILTGAYRVRPAQRIWVIKDDGGERGITIFCVRDRVALGAVRRALGRVVGPTLSPASFAYREGLGALRAAHRLIEHRRSGHTWVLRSDIRDYFDSISHELLLGQLKPFLDSAALELFGWILRVPIRDGNAVHIPERGIAQGSPISPMLSNLFLSGFDAHLNRDGRRLVRFADDFVVAASTVKGAAEGMEVAQAQVERLGLKLNESKTQIVSFEQGFDFLGFFFDADTVRISQKNMAEFKAHLEALLISRFDQFGPSSIQKANELIRGWRNYFQLGDVRQDYAVLEEWIESRFGHKAKLLERLIPDHRGVRAPRLGGYTRSSPDQSQPSMRGRFTPKVATNHNKKRPLPFPSVRLDQSGTPVTVRRSGAILNVATFPDLPSSETLEDVRSELEQASLFHRANMACRWKTPGCR